jgi:hypothetical protein
LDEVEEYHEVLVLGKLGVLGDGEASHEVLVLGKLGVLGDGEASHEVLFLSPPVVEVLPRVELKNVPFPKPPVVEALERVELKNVPPNPPPPEVELKLSRRPLPENEVPVLRPAGPA